MGDRAEKRRASCSRPLWALSSQWSIIKRDFPPVFSSPPTNNQTLKFSLHIPPLASSLPTRFLIPYNVASTALFTETVLLNIRNFITKSFSDALLSPLVFWLSRVGSDLGTFLPERLDSVAPPLRGVVFPHLPACLPHEVYSLLSLGSEGPGKPS